MATVIDASVMAAQLLPDEAHSDFARALLEQLDNEERIAPVIYWYEIRNVLLKARRLRRIAQGQYDACLIQLTDELSLREDTERNEARGSGPRTTPRSDSIRRQLSGNSHPAQSQAGNFRPKPR